jgi:transposase InsO family protein
MMIALHKNATTTPAVRAQIQQSSASEYELAEQYGISRTTVQRWKRRNSVEDRSHTPHRLQTTLNAGQEELVVYLRKQLRLPLDDLLSVVREFIHPEMGRSSLHRLLVRRGVDKLPKPSPESSPAKPFKAYEPGYVHIDVKYLPQMADEASRGYVFVAIDRATRWVFISIKRRKTAAAARSFLKELAKAAPFVISTILTDNGKEFTDRLFGSRAKDASGEHEFDLLCDSLGIEHRLTRPRTPQTNGMVERFNGRLEQVLQTHRFNSAEDLSKTLHRYVWLYNQHLPQKALDHQTPLMAMKKWQESHPHLFTKRVVNHPGPDSYPRSRNPTIPQRAARISGRFAREGEEEGGGPAEIHEAEETVVVEPPEVVADGKVIVDHGCRYDPAVLHGAQSGAWGARLQQGADEPDDAAHGDAVGQPPVSGEPQRHPARIERDALPLPVAEDERMDRFRIEERLPVPGVGRQQPVHDMPGRHFTTAPMTEH